MTVRPTLLLAACALLAACSTRSAREGERSPDGARAGSATAVAGGDRASAAPASFTFTGALDVRPYSGRCARDERLSARLHDLEPAYAAARDTAADAAGLEFAEGRTPLVELVDDLAGELPGRVDLRLVGGVRRPVVRLDAARVAAGRVDPRTEFGALIVEGALLTAFGDRETPDWLRAGLGMALTDSDARLAVVRVLDDPLLREGDAWLGTDPADALLAAVRMRTVLRIARGDKALSRFLATLRDGKPLAAALAAVGVDDEVFLEAAQETSRAEFLRRFRDDADLAALFAARDALHAGDAEAALESLQRLPAKDPLTLISADAELVRAEIDVQRHTPQDALKRLEHVLTDPARVVRFERALALRARAAAESDRADLSRAAVTALLRDAPDVPAASGALGLPGDDPERGRRVRALGSADPAVRREAVTRTASLGAAAEKCLVFFTGDPEPDVRTAALSALLAATHAAAPLPAAVVAVELTAGTRDAAPAVRREALRLLSQFDRNAAQGVARSLIDDPDPSVRDFARGMIPAPAKKPVTPEPRATQPKVAPRSTTPPKKPEPAPPLPAPPPGK